jgi:hypothetical protein
MLLYSCCIESLDFSGKRCPQEQSWCLGSLKILINLVGYQFYSDYIQTWETKFAQLHNLCPNMNLNLLQVTLVTSPGMSWATASTKVMLGFMRSILNYVWDSMTESKPISYFPFADTWELQAACRWPHFWFLENFRNLRDPICWNACQVSSSLLLLPIYHWQWTSENCNLTWKAMKTR